MLKLGDCVRLINGRAYSQHELLDTGTPIIRIQNLNGGDRWYYSDLTLPEDKYCRDGDLLFAWSASFGPYIWRGEKSIFHYHIWRVIPNELIDKAFAFLLLDWITAKVKEASHGVAMLHMTKAGMEAWLVPIPPIAEQRRIAAILDQSDALRAKRRECLTQLDSLTQSIFIEMFGDARVEVNRWPVVPFDEIVLESRIGLVRGSQELDPGHPYPYLRMNAITRDGDLRLTGALYAKATDDELALYQLRRGDFLFNTRNSRELVGKTALFRSDEQYLFNNNLLRVRFKKEANAEYVLAAFKTPFIQSELENRKSGTTNVFAVYYKDLRTLPIPQPPIVQQEVFANRVQIIQELKAIHSASLAQLETLFVSLQHRAFRGEL
jgi:type I restriction enzyme S subunit